MYRLSNLVGHWVRFNFLTLLLLLTSFIALSSKFIGGINFDAVLEKTEAVYGAYGAQNTKAWLAFLDDEQSSSEWQKVNKVNTFFNTKINYQRDNDLWGKEDYWASPVETLGRGAGDCEDFAIAKYFSLMALGVPEEKIRLMYVRLLTLNEPHMVLVYFEEPNSVPFVLDNFNHSLLPATRRNDLKPIYSFNGNGLWLAKAKGQGQKVKNSKGVSAWDQMLQRVEQGELYLPKNSNQGENYAQIN